MIFLAPLTASTYDDAYRLFFQGASLVLCIDGDRQYWCVSAAEANWFFLGYDSKCPQVNRDGQAEGK